MLKDLKKNQIITHQIFHDLLLSQDGDSVRWPDDNEFKRGWLTEPVYKNAGPARTKMFLDAIDMALNTSRQENVPLDGEISVENIMPKNKNASGWKIIIPSDVSEQKKIDLLK